MVQGDDDEHGVAGRERGAPGHDHVVAGAAGAHADGRRHRRGVEHLDGDAHAPRGARPRPGRAVAERDADARRDAGERLDAVHPQREEPGRRAARDPGPLLKGAPVDCGAHVAGGRAADRQDDRVVDVLAPAPERRDGDPGRRGVRGARRAREREVEPSLPGRERPQHDRVVGPGDGRAASARASGASEIAGRTGPLSVVRATGPPASAPAAAWAAPVPPSSGSSAQVRTASGPSIAAASRGLSCGGPSLPNR